MSPSDDLFFYIRGVLADIEWPLIVHANANNFELTERLAKCVPHGCVVVFPGPTMMTMAHETFAERNEIVVARQFLTNPKVSNVDFITLDEWAARYGVDKIAALVCDQPNDYIEIATGAPRLMKTCKLLFSPVESYSGMARVRSDIADLAKGWMEYKRWTYDGSAKEEVLLFNEGL